MTSWVRLWHDMPTDPKWRVIARKSGQPITAVIAVFNMMLINASANAGERGFLLNFDSEDVGAALDMLPEDVDAILDAMQHKVLEGKRLSGWENRQPKREDDGARARKEAWKQREKEKRNAPERNGTHRNDTDADADADAETDKIEPNGSRASGDALSVENVLEFWNEKAPAWNKARVITATPERRKLVKARIAEHGLDGFRDMLNNFGQSEFLQRSKACGFDWAMKKGNFLKVREGNYNG